MSVSNCFQLLALGSVSYTHLVVDRNKSYSKARETARIFDGWELGCKLNYTVVRGRVLMEDGVVDPDCAGYGQLVTPQK